MHLPSALLGPSSKKIKKTHPEKNSLYFKKRNFITLIFKNFLYFRKRKPWKKIPYISGNRNPKKDYYILGNGTFQPTLENIKKSTPRKFLILQETEIPKAFLIF